MSRILAIILALGIGSPGSSAPAAEPPQPPEPVTEADSDVPADEEREVWESMRPMEKATVYRQEQNYKLAEKAYVEVLESPAPMENKKRALHELAEVYVEMKMLAKAASTLENALATFSKSPDRPKTLYRLGEIYREMGLKDEAIAVFYRVLNSIVVTGEENLDRYMGTARLAQFEIARIHYEQEDHDRAYMLFDRIDLLELDDADRETVLYYKALSSLKAGHEQQALELMNEFTEAFPRSELLAEILYLKAEVLSRMDRLQASEDQLINLLEAVGPPGQENRAQWNFWRKQAGNRLANKYYRNGDYRVAIRIYQGMVGLEDSPEWQIPIIYQIGLAFEKAGIFDRARESYTYIVQETEALQEPLPSENLQTIVRSARWRQDLMDWRIELDQRRAELAADASRPSTPAPTGT
jgi:tetratricopeptide (TPR) repeat protein